MLSSKGRLVALVVLVVALVCVTAALASKPHKGYVYATSNTSFVSVYFKVAKNGKKVTNLDVGTPIKCPKSVGGVGGLPGAKRNRSASITRDGTFKAKLTLYSIGPKPKKAGSVTITGKFSDDHATGKVSDKFNSNKGVCKATTRSYTAIGYAPVG
jgi:hypothetical protein